jgi:hypothetical protein
MAHQKLEQRARNCLMAAESAQSRSDLKSAEHFRAAAEYLLQQAARVKHHEQVLEDELVMCHPWEGPSTKH